MSPFTSDPRTAIVVVGAGPAGLAAAACLGRRGQRTVLLERGEAPGWSWHRHYDSLRLHTPREDSALPGLAFEAATSRYPTRREVTEYLRAYAERFSLDLRCGETVESLAWRGDAWEVASDRGRRLARRLVVATGMHQIPRRPAELAIDRFDGPILHSSEYTNGARFAGRRVLVVGFGNTGADLVADLAAHGARPAVAVRGPVHLAPLELAGIPWHRWFRRVVYPVLAAARRLGPAGRPLEAIAGGLGARLQRRRFGDLEARGLRLKGRRELVEHWRQGRPPVTAGPALELLRRGVVAVFPPPAALGPDGVTFAGGRREPFDAVVLATGFRSAMSELVPVDLPAPARSRLHLAGEAPLLKAIAVRAEALAREIARAETAR